MNTNIGRVVCAHLLAAAFIFGIHTPVLAQTKAAPAKVEKIYKVVSVQLARLKSNPPQLVITAIGQTRSGGWKSSALSPRIYINPPQNGIQDFDFFAEPPVGAAPDVITSTTAHTTIKRIPGWLKGVRAHSSTNTEEAMLVKAVSVKMN